MKFTVVIPVYNGEKFIERSISSVLNQTYSEIELIVVNDGSTDNTEEVINGIIKDNADRDITYKKIQNSGPSTARNVGIDLATGDYICFLDSDDQYDKNLFTDLSNVLNGEDICFFGWEEINENSGEKAFRYEDRFGYTDDAVSGKEAALLKFENKIWLCNCNEVYSLDLLKRNNIHYLQGVYSGEDTNFIYKCLLNANKVISLRGDYFINYIRPDSLMHSSFSTRSLTSFDAGKDLYNYAVDNNFEPNICDALFTDYYNSRISVAKRIARSLKWYQGIKFIKYCKKYIPKIKKERKLLLDKKERNENRAFRFKLLFFWIYKYFVYRKR